MRCMICSFFQSVDCLLLSWWCHFDTQNFNCNEVQCTYFSSVASPLSGIFEKLLPNPRAWIFSCFKNKLIFVDGIKVQLHSSTCEYLVFQHYLLKSLSFSYWSWHSYWLANVAQLVGALSVNWKRWCVWFPVRASAGCNQLMLLSFSPFPSLKLISISSGED